MELKPKPLKRPIMTAGGWALVVTLIWILLFAGYVQRNGFSKLALVGAILGIAATWIGALLRWR